MPQAPQPPGALCPNHFAGAGFILTITSRARLFGLVYEQLAFVALPYNPSTQPALHLVIPGSLARVKILISAPPFGCLLKLKPDGTPLAEAFGILNPQISGR